MAAKTSITRIHAAEPLNRLIRLDRLEFRKLLDLYYKALRADWVYHETRQKFGTKAAADKGHTAASAWTPIYARPSRCCSRPAPVRCRAAVT